MKLIYPYIEWSRCFFCVSNDVAAQLSVNFRITNHAKEKKRKGVKERQAFDPVWQNSSSSLALSHSPS